MEEEDLYLKTRFKLPSIEELFYPEIDANPKVIQFVVRERSKFMIPYMNEYKALLEMSLPADKLVKEAAATLKWIAYSLEHDWADALVREHYSSTGKLPCIYTYTDGRDPEGSDEAIHKMACRRFDYKVGHVDELAALRDHIEKIKYEVDRLAYSAKWFHKYGH